MPIHRIVELWVQTVWFLVVVSNKSGMLIRSNKSTNVDLSKKTSENSKVSFSNLRSRVEVCDLGRGLTSCGYQQPPNYSTNYLSIHLFEISGLGPNRTEVK